MNLNGKTLIGIVAWNVIITFMLLGLLIMYGSVKKSNEISCDCKMPVKEGYVSDMVCSQNIPNSSVCAWGTYLFIKEEIYKEVVKNEQTTFQSN